MTYGNEAQGLAPQRLKQLRLQLDLQTGGSLDTFYDQHPDLVDWWETAIERQCMALAWGVMHELEHS